MRKKIRSLCVHFPKVPNPQSALDNIALRIFNPERDGFMQSSMTPRERYGLKIDSQFSQYNNDLLDTFGQFGPNEQFLVNKILFGPNPLLYIVGGIGVGKSSFLNFLMHDVFPELKHKKTEKKPFCPQVIYLDLNPDASPWLIGRHYESIEAAFMGKLCTRISAAIGDKFFDLEEEVDKIWEHILSSSERNIPKNDAFEYIRVRLRDLDAGSSFLKKSRAGVIPKRKDIRLEVVGNPALHPDYLAALIRYIRENELADHPCCLILIIDNIDVQPSLVQHAVRSVLQPFILNGGIPTVVAARQTTFYQQFDGGISVPADCVPYCGVTPCEVIDRRIERFLESPEQFTSELSEEQRNLLLRGTRFIFDRMWKDRRVRELVTSICGNSVRKALILGQRLMHNSVYTPSAPAEGSNETPVRLGDVMRAILVGTADAFKWSPEAIIENVFQINEWPCESFFIKLRVLCALRYDRLRLSRIVEVLQGFGYRIEVICSGLNELMLNTKRLIWSDSVLEFSGVDDLLSRGSTWLALSSAGKGYAEKLYQRLEYIQEVMLDTFVDSFDLGSRWEYGRIEDRFGLVQEFLKILVQEDLRETKYFCSSYGAIQYRRVFRDQGLISLAILLAIRRDVARILGERRPRVDDFVSRHLAVYDDLIIRMTNEEESLSLTSSNLVSDTPLTYVTT